jgi:hypothetical protein
MGDPVRTADPHDNRISPEEIPVDPQEGGEILVSFLNQSGSELRR